LTGKKIAAATGVAVPAVPAVPADPNPLTRLPAGYVLAYRVDNSNDFMPGDPWVFETGKMALFRQRITVTYATGLNLDSYSPRTWFRNVAFDYFEGSAWPRDLHCTHLGHK